MIRTINLGQLSELQRQILESVNTSEQLDALLTSGLICDLFAGDIDGLDRDVFRELVKLRPLVPRFFIKEDAIIFEFDPENNFNVLFPLFTFVDHELRVVEFVDDNEKATLTVHLAECRDPLYTADDLQDAVLKKGYRGVTTHELLAVTPYLPKEGTVHYVELGSYRAYGNNENRYCVRIKDGKASVFSLDAPDHFTDKTIIFPLIKLPPRKPSRYR